MRRFGLLPVVLVAVSGSPSLAQSAPPPTQETQDSPAVQSCSGVDALGRTVERACAATVLEAPPGNTVLSESDIAKLDAGEGAQALAKLSAPFDPYKKPRDIRGKTQFAIGLGPVKVDNTEATRKRIERERTDPFMPKG